MPMMVGKQAGGRDFRVRFVVISIVMGIALLLLIGRLYHLQIQRGAEFKEKGIDNFIKETRLPADRGMILDNRGRILVDSRPSYNVTLTPAFCQPSGKPKGYCLDEIIPRLATYLSLDADEVARVIEQYQRARRLERFRDFAVKVDVDLDSLDRFEANRLDLAGVDVVIAPHRRYRHGTLAAHVLGYMNEISGDELAGFEAQGTTHGYQLGDYIGRRGVERRFEGDLRGTDGTIKSVVDAKGRKNPDSDFLLADIDWLTPAKSGHNLVLSLSLPLQQVAEKAFERATAGAIVAVDVNTGFLLAVVSKPAYDPNKLTGRITRAELKAISEDPLEPLIFRVAQQHYHPGSTFKVVTALAGLEQGIISSTTGASCNGGYSLGKRRWRCHKDSGHGLVNLHTALAWSCDTFFYQAGDRMGVDPIADISRKLGLGRVPGLDLSPETPGVVPSVEYHNRITPGGYTKGLALNTSIGQGDNNVSPLQLAMAYAAIGNGGTLYKPQVVRRIEDGEGHLVRAIEPVVAGKLDIKPQSLALVVDGLRAVVNEPGGTAYSKRPKGLDVVIAGKTGTAQVIALGEKRVKKDQMEYFTRDHAWFAAFAPADAPEIAVVVLNEHGG
ncbi:MAG: penicillin-binding protein 2, partial [Deltaproteobacteria bacterium]|nr:penicillin-binding protein 2 [Deltaproteobacteria bacterium]